jgi:alkanesulfonate monooxygenase SsuD/methylene tetrahydromethanopterin reductase-like flavin-dependent oxidoreductase (luciferase family)
MGEGPAVPPVTGSIETVADRLAEFIDCGLAELMVVLDPITSDSVRWLGGVAAVTRRLTSG